MLHFGDCTFEFIIFKETHVNHLFGFTMHMVTTFMSDLFQIPTETSQELVSQDFLSFKSDQLP